jgi:repressor LexA
MYLIDSLFLLAYSNMKQTTDPGLTPQRRKIIRVIEESLQGRGYPPSLREIGQAVGLASTSSVSYQMSVLEATGYLSRETGRPRTTVLRDPDEPGPDAPGPDAGPARRDDKRMTDVPLVGRIAAGVPILADETPDDVISLPKLLTGEGSLIALRVRGDSMIGAAITDGDWVVVRRQPDADNGDIVAAMLESDASADREATVKTLKRADGHTWLIPHNPVYAPILADRAVIIGKVVSVLRRLLRVLAGGQAGVSAWSRRTTASASPTCWPMFVIELNACLTVPARSIT